MQSQNDQKCRPLDLVREKTDKIKCSFDNFRIMFKGYNKMRSRMLPKGVSMLMTSNQQDEDDEGPFKRGGIRAGIRNSQRRVSCPEDDVLERMKEHDEEYSSLPPISLNFDNQICEETNSECKKKTSRSRSNSLFEFLGKKETSKGDKTEHRHSLPSSSTDDAPTVSKPKSFKFIPKAEKRHIKRIPKGTFTSTETGAILPSVLLTYHPSACNLPSGCKVLNEYDFYLQSNQMEGIRA